MSLFIQYGFNLPNYGDLLLLQKRLQAYVHAYLVHCSLYLI